MTWKSSWHPSTFILFLTRVSKPKEIFSRLLNHLNFYFWFSDASFFRYFFLSDLFLTYPRDTFFVKIFIYFIWSQAPPSNPNPSPLNPFLRTWTPNCHCLWENTFWTFFIMSLFKYCTLPTFLAAILSTNLYFGQGLLKDAENDRFWTKLADFFLLKISISKKGK